MSKSIQVYADIANIVHEGNGMNILMVGTDVSQVVAEYDVEEVLDSLDFDAIAQYVIKKRIEDNE